MLLSYPLDMLLTVEDTAKILGVSKSTMRRWEAEGRQKPERTPDGHRRYRSEELMQMTVHPLPQTDRVTLAYVRVSSHDQKADLARQAMVLSEFCTKNGWTHEVIRDCGSGMNYHKKGLRALLQRIMRNDVERLVITHRDRLLRFGGELVFAICEEFQTEVVIVKQSEDTRYEDELTQDVWEIIRTISKFR
ncbi:MAG: IS607 family transposase [Sulfobacillus benefaciens]|uniref:IS607 family transposase n=1 Tax=Sulfobacillus benefaciens TaxID=453960 RepID=A0A2T2XLH4_9FIRM|nr:MAG: IS607 family transposase [Sulfobacillus benefaciens]